MSSQTAAAGEWCRELFEAQAAKLILYGRALGLAHSEAEDVVQEVFLELIRRAGPPEQPLRFVLRAFRNRAINHRRSSWRRFTREFESARWFETSIDTVPAERAAMVALAQLPAEQREVIVLKLWHQLTFEEIATHLEASPNTVAARYRYGVLKLRAALKGKDHEELERLGNSSEALDSEATLGPVEEGHLRATAC